MHNEEAQGCTGFGQDGVKLLHSLVLSCWLGLKHNTERQDNYASTAKDTSLEKASYHSGGKKFQLQILL